MKEEKKKLKFYIQSKNINFAVLLSNTK